MATVDVTTDTILNAKLAGTGCTISPDEFKMLMVRNLITFAQDAKTGAANMPHMHGVRLYVATSKAYPPPA